MGTPGQHRRYSSGAGHRRDPVLVVIGETCQRRLIAERVGSETIRERTAHAENTASACVQRLLSAFREPFTEPICGMVRMVRRRAGARHGQAYRPARHLGMDVLGTPRLAKCGRRSAWRCPSRRRPAPVPLPGAPSPFHALTHWLRQILFVDCFSSWRSSLLSHRMLRQGVMIFLLPTRVSVQPMMACAWSCPDRGRDCLACAGSPCARIHVATGSNTSPPRLSTRAASATMPTACAQVGENE
jgi:hypothetical protein